MIECMNECLFLLFYVCMCVLIEKIDRISDLEYVIYKLIGLIERSSD